MARTDKIPVWPVWSGLPARPWYLVRLDAEGNRRGVQNDKGTVRRWKSAGSAIRFAESSKDLFIPDPAQVILQEE